MHISEGILSVPVLVSGATLAAAGTAVGLRKMDYDRIPQVAVLSAAFFVASLIHVPLGPASVHLILTGLMGVFLGWAAFPAILIGLLLQTLLFQYGGLTTLGVNCLIMAFPSVLCFTLFQRGIKSRNHLYSKLASFLCGAVSVLIAGVILAIALVSTGDPFIPIAKIIFVAHLPLMIIEGAITLFCVQFFKRVKPEMLEVIYAP
jgi:cobalt/nickel transport system permease protein